MTFADTGGKTALSLQQAMFATVAARDEQRRGRSNTMWRFAEYPATLFFTG
jgi:hypothetical protein